MIVEVLPGLFRPVTERFHDKVRLYVVRAAGRQLKEEPVLPELCALAGDVLDLKWKNSTEYPVYMEVTADGWEVTVAFYGVETRPENRTVEYVSQTEGSTPPGEDVITVDGSKPAGYYEVTQSAFYGYTASLYKNVYIYKFKDTYNIKYSLVLGGFKNESIC